MKSSTLTILLALWACTGHRVDATPAASRAGDAQPAVEAPGSLPLGPLQGSVAMQNLLRRQRQDLEALEAREAREAPGGQDGNDAVVLLKAQQELERLDLLAVDAEKQGRREEAERARREAARLRAPAPVKAVRFVQRVAPDASVPMGAATPAQENSR